MTGLPECPPTVAIKLASIAAHVREVLTSEDRSIFDILAVKGLLEDPEVRDYLGTLDSLALLPVPRT